MVICVLANLGYVCQLYNKFTDRKSYWAMQAKEAFMKSVDMEVESRILKALNEVRSFSRLAGGGIGFYNADNTLVMVLTKI